jgi:hypothetical protein
MLSKFPLGMVPSTAEGNKASWQGEGIAVARVWSRRSRTPYSEASMMPRRMSQALSNRLSKRDRVSLAGAMCRDAIEVINTLPRPEHTTSSV